MNRFSSRPSRSSRFSKVKLKENKKATVDLKVKYDDQIKIFHAMSLFVTLNELEIQFKKEFSLSDDSIVILKYLTATQEIKLVKSDNNLIDHFSSSIVEDTPAVLILSLEKPLEETPACSGWVEFSTGLLKIHKRRYLVLNDNCLTWFKKDNMPKTFKGAITLDGCWISEKNEMGIVIKKKGGKDYTIGLKSQEDKDKWRKAFEDSISRSDIMIMRAADSNHEDIDYSSLGVTLPDTIGMRIIRCGWLEKRGHIVKNWKMRFFVLSDVCISYYRSPPETPQDFAKAKGIMPLRSGSLVKMKEGRIRDFCILFVHATRGIFMSGSSRQEIALWYKDIGEAVHHLHKNLLIQSEQLLYEARNSQSEGFTLVINYIGISLHRGYDPARTTLEPTEENTVVRHPHQNIKRVKAVNTRLHFDFGEFDKKYCLIIPPSAAMALHTITLAIEVNLMKCKGHTFSSSSNEK